MEHEVIKNNAWVGVASSYSYCSLGSVSEAHSQLGETEGDRQAYRTKTGCPTTVSS